MVKFQYKIADHLGNTAVLFGDDNNDGVITTEQTATPTQPSEVLQRQFYYSFGMSMEGLWTPQTTPGQDFLYNGKELHDDLGLNWYNYGARWYDASIGRWCQVDPLAEKYYAWSGYNYCLGNPVIFIDPDGMKVTFADSESKNNYKQLKKAYKKANPDRYNDLIRLEKVKDVTYRINTSSKELSDTYNATTRLDKSSTENMTTINVLVKENLSSDKRVAMADELEHARQFLDGEIGFKEHPTKGSSHTGYDIQDEINSQQASVDAADALDIELSDMQKDFISMDSQTFINQWYSGISNRKDKLNGQDNLSDDRVKPVYFDNGGYNRIVYRNENKNIIKSNE